MQTPSSSTPDAAPQPASGTAPSATRQELRAQLEELERVNLNVRANAHQVSAAAYAAASRIAELERVVASMPSRRPTAPLGRSAAVEDPMDRRGRDVDPGDSVPEGVAPLDPPPMDAEAEAARDNLERHLGNE